MLDSTEGFDGDHDGVADVTPSGSDANDNGIDDAFEGSAPALPDTDGDGTADFRDADDDGDGIDTVYEAPGGSGTPAQDTDGDGTPDYLDPDDDGDGVNTVDENPDANGDGNPEDAADSDGDGTPDYLDPDMNVTGGGLSGGAFCSASSGSTGSGAFGLVFLLGLALIRRRR